VAIEWVKSPVNKMPSSLAEMCTLYKYFKQVKSGDVTGDQPWSYQIEARAKWDAWKTCEGLSSEEAMQGYTDALTQQATKYGKMFP